MGGGIGSVSSQNAPGILDGWMDVTSKKDAETGEVEISTHEIDVSNNIVNDIKPEAVEKLDHPKPERSAGTQGVQHLSSLVHPEPITGDMSTVSGARDTLVKYCSSVRAKILDQGGVSAIKAKFAEKIAKMANEAETPEQKKALDGVFKKYEAFLMKCNELQTWREQMLAYFPKPREGGLKPGATEAQLDKQALAELNEMRVAVRNFRYDFDKFNAPGKITTRRYLGQVFSTTRNKFFRGFTKMEVMKFRGDKDLRTDAEHKALNGEQRIPQHVFANEQLAAYGLFDLATDLAKAIGVENDLPSVNEFARVSAEEHGKTSVALLKLEEAVRTKTGDIPLSKAGREQLLKTLKEIGDSKKGGFKRLALTVSAGGVLPIPVAQVAVGVKYQYCLDISSTPGGGIRIARVHSAGIKADLEAGIKEVAQAKASAEFMGGKGNVIEYRNLKEAVAALSGGKGYGALRAVLTGGIGMSLLDIPRKWIDRAFGQKNNYNENAFLRFARKNGYLEKTDKVLAPGENERYASRQKITRLGGGGHGSIQAKIAQIRADLDLHGHRAFVTEKTEFRSLFTYLRSERKGEAASLYAERNYKDSDLVKDKAVRDLLVDTRDPGSLSAEDLAAAREEIRAQLAEILSNVIDLSDEVNDKLAEGEKYTKDQMSALARQFPQATLAAQALLDRLEQLSEGVPEAERKEDAELSSLVEQALTNPPIAFPKDVYEETFNVTRVHHEGNGHFEFDFRFAYNLGAQHLENVLSGDLLSPVETYTSGTTGEKVGLGALRAGASGVSSVVSNLTGAASTLQVHVTHDNPKTDDPRPWKKHKTTTLDIKLLDNLPTRAIYALVMQAVSKTISDKKSGCAEAGLSVGGLAERELIKFLGGALSTAFDDITGGWKPEEKKADDVKPFAEAALDDFVWESLKNIRLTWEDGKLASVSFGDAETFRLEVKGTVGHFQARAGVSYESLVNTRTMLNNPTFETMAGLCDAFLRNENRTAWKECSEDNRKAFLKMFDALSGQSKSKDALASLRQLEELRMRMADEIVAEADPEKRARLEKCFAELSAAVEKLREHSLEAMPEKAEDKAAMQGKRVADVRAVMEAAARYFDVVEDNGNESIFNPVANNIVNDLNNIVNDPNNIVNDLNNIVNDYDDVLKGKSSDEIVFKP